MTVSNVELSVPFYRDVLFFRKTSDTVFDQTSDMSPSVPVRRVRLDLGTECIEVDEPLGGVRRPIPADSRSNDRCVFSTSRSWSATWTGRTDWLETHRVAHVWPHRSAFPSETETPRTFEPTTQGPRWAHPGIDFGFPRTRARRAGTRPRATRYFGHRPHGNRRSRYEFQSRLLRRLSGAPGRGRKRELGTRTRALEQRARRTPADHRVTRRRRAGRRTS